LFEWSLPSVFFAFLACVGPVKNSTTRLLLAMIVSQTATDMFNQFNNYTFGPRYLYNVSSQLVILTAVGICQLPALFQHLAQLSPRFEMPSLRAAQGMAALIVLLVCATGIYRMPMRIREYNHLTDYHPMFYYDMLAQSKVPALVFLGRPEKDNPHPEPKFRWIAWLNPQSDHAPLIFAADRGPNRNAELVRRYPGRKVYFENNNKLVPAEIPFTHTP
jgi:hypothetical protein